MSALSDILRRRGVKRVVAFHTDHFEPMGLDGTGAPIGPDHVERWLRRTADLPFAARASLFYLSHAFTSTDPAAPAPTYREHPVESAILRLLAEHGRDVQLHVHHEVWCTGPVTRWPVDTALDTRRLEAFLPMFRAHLRAHGLSRDDGWAHVHGQWALQASDRSVCQITDELRVLMEHGCYGDFTFPAGRKHCNPAEAGPYTVRPIDAEKGYAQRAADPRRVDVGAGAIAPGRFLVWSSDVGYEHSSLDAVSDPTRGITGVVERWVARSPVLGGALFLKTHAHSLAERYWPEAARSRSPFFTKPVADAFAALERACEDARVPLDYETVTGANSLLAFLDLRSPP